MRYHPESLRMSVLLTMLVALGPISTDLYLPTLPALVRVFDTSVATTQLTLSVFMTGFALSQLVYGPLSDRFGRRPVLLGGVALYVVGSLLCLIAPSIGLLIVARLIQAVGACCGPVLGRAVVRDVHGRERAAKVLAYMAMAMALAPAVGPMIGGALTVWSGWRACFAVLAGLGTLLLGAVWWGLPETNHLRDPDAIRPRRLLAHYLHLFGDRVFMGYVATVAFTFSGLFSFISGSSFVLIDGMGVSQPVFGLCFGVVVVGYMVGSLIAARATMRLGGDRMIGLGGLVGVLGGGAGFALAWGGVAEPAAVVGPMALVMAGAGMVLPNAFAGAIGPYPGMAGLASSLLGFSQMALAAGAGAVVGHLHDGTSVPMTAAICLSTVAGWLAHRLLIRPVI